MYTRHLFLTLFVVAASLLLAPMLPAKTCDATLLTGPKSGYYFKLGTAIAQVAGSQAFNLCVEPTDHNLENVTHLQSGDADFAIVQSDVAHDAWYGHPPRFKSRASEVSIVMHLYVEAVHILLRPHLNISRLEDLKDKTVGVGHADSGTEQTAKHILAAVGLQSEGSAKNYQAVASDSVFCSSVRALMAGELDALFRVTVVPSPDIFDAVKLDPGKEGSNDDCTAAWEIRLLPLNHDLAERLVSDGSYIETLIPKHAYQQAESTLTVGVQALMLAGKNANPDQVEKLAKILRFKHAEIEDALSQTIGHEHAGHHHGAENLPTLSLLDVPNPVLRNFVHPRASNYVYHWWRKSWKPELIILAILFLCAGLVYRARNGLGRIMQRQPNLFFAVARTFLIWFIAACVLYHFGGVDEHFNSFPRSLISTFLYLTSCPGYALLNQDADSFAQLMKWISAALLGGFALPLLKQGLDALLERMSRCLQCEQPSSDIPIIAPKNPSTAAGDFRSQALAPGAD